MHLMITYRHVLRTFLGTTSSEVVKNFLRLVTAQNVKKYRFLSRF